MASVSCAVSQILAGEQGSYVWPNRCCVSTAMALYSRLCAKPRARVQEILQTYTRQSEARAWARVTKIGVWNHYKETLGRDATTVTDLAPGDFVFFHERISVQGGHVFPAQKNQEALAFVDDSFLIWHWTPSGLLPVQSPARARRVLRIA